LLHRSEPAPPCSPAVASVNKVAALNLNRKPNPEKRKVLRSF